VELDHVPAMSELMADVHADGVRVFELLNDLHENSQDLYLGRVAWLAMVRIRVLETRLAEAKAECATFESRLRA
jgi:hypothetical protein